MDFKLSLSVPLFGVLFGLSDIAKPDISASEGFTVISYNIGNVAEEIPEAAEVWHTVYRYRPDILLLQEAATFERTAEIAAYMEQEYGGHTAYEFTRDIGNGVAVISRFPINGITVIPGSGVYGGAVVTADIGGRKVLLASIHLPYIPKERDDSGNVNLGFCSTVKTVGTEFLFDTPRSSLIKTLRERICEMEWDAVIAGGDFNTVPFSRVQTVMQNGFSDSLYLKKDYLSSSYRKIGIPVGARSDFIFSSPGLFAAESSVIRNSSGDHYPVFARFKWVETKTDE